MRPAYTIFICLSFVLCLLLLATGCQKRKVDPGPFTRIEDPNAASSAAAAEAARKAKEEELARQRALEEENLRAQGAAGSMDEKGLLAGGGTADDPDRIDRELFELEDVYFDFDSASLNEEAINVLKRKAQWLANHPEVRLVIEGHCDDRGTNEYNLALGDRRAEAAKAYLVELGVSGSKITTLSYGEERPVDTGDSEEARAKNRRDHFVLK